MPLFLDSGWFMLVLSFQVAAMLMEMVFGTGVQWQLSLLFLILKFSTFTRIVFRWHCHYRFKSGILLSLPFAFGTIEMALVYSIFECMLDSFNLIY